MARAETLPWGKLSRAFLAAQAMSPHNPDWQRAAFAAWHRVGFSGVARFDPGELATVAAAPDKVTGEDVPLTNARRAVRDAVAHGWLEPGSTTTEVIVHGNKYGVGRY